MTFLPKLVTLGAFGKHEFNLISSGFATNKTWFRSKVEKGVKPMDLGPLSAGGTRTPTAPELQEVAARQSLRLKDPSDWERRVEVQNKHSWELYHQGQTGTDLTFFFQEKGQRYMAIPFEPDESRGSQKFVPKAGQKIMRRPRPQVVAVVYPPRGTEQAVVEAGRKMLEKVLKQRQLRKTGVLRMIPHWLAENGAPDADEQAKLLIRLELPVAKK